MFSSRRFQNVLFFVTFINCLLVFTITFVSLTTEYWVIIKPYRQISSDALNIKQKIIESLNSSINVNSSLLNDDELDYSMLIDDDIEDDQIIDLSSRVDCKRFQGVIRFGLFKGVWLLNYAFGCKYRLHRVSIIEALSKDKLFDQTLWICTILCCSLSLFTIFLSALFSLLNAVLSPSNPIHGPLSMYLWNSLSIFFHALGILIFSVEFYYYINKNILTKEQIESGWVSTERGQLGWSFYILFISLILILINIVIIYLNSKYKKSFFNIKNICEKNETLIETDKPGIKTEYQQIDDTISTRLEIGNEELNIDEKRTS